MAHLVVQSAFERTTGIPADRVVNTFHFDTAATAATTADYNAAVAHVAEFFGSADTVTGVTLASMMPNTVLSGAWHLKCYDQSDPTPRVPRVDLATTLGLFVAAGTLPTEVALCLSYAGNIPAGANPRRKRGRVYIGPFIPSTVGPPTAGDARPTSVLQNTLAGVGHRMALYSAADVRWCVYSPTDHLLEPIKRVWVDNAFDTQRRRGAKATGRVTITNP